MKHSVDSVQQAAANVSVEAPKDNSVQERLEKLAAQAKADGFRPGKIPRSIIEQKLNDALEQQLESMQVALSKQSAMHPDVLLMQHNIAELEARKTQYPMVNMTEAAAAMGVTDRTNGSKDINRAEKKGKLFTVEFFNGKRLVPLFQLDLDAKKPMPIVKTLLTHLTDNHQSPVESWLVYDWFTSPIDDEMAFTPAELLSEPEAHEELIYLAKQAGAKMAGRVAV